MACNVTATAKSGKYEIETEYITDPSRNTVLMHVRSRRTNRVSVCTSARRHGERQRRRRLGQRRRRLGDRRRVDRPPVLVSYDTNTATNAANRDYAQPVYEALDGPLAAGRAASSARPTSSIDSDDTPTRSDGNVVQHARVQLGDDGTALLALGFGATQNEAVGTAEGSLAAASTSAFHEYKKGWKHYDDSLNKPPQKLTGLQAKTADELADEYYLSANVLKASEDKTFPGAIVASLASPWGQAVSPATPRTPTSARTARCSRATSTRRGRAWSPTATSRPRARATLFLFERQQLPDGSMPRNSLVNGKVAPDSFETQLDECAYPILMAYQLGLTDAALYANHIKPAANFVAAHGPSFGLRALGGAGRLLALDDRRRDRRPRRGGGDREGQRRTRPRHLWLGVADDFQRSIKGWTSRPAGRSRRATSPALEDRPTRTRRSVQRRQRRADARPARSDRRRLLELVRLGELPASDPDWSDRCRWSTPRSSPTPRAARLAPLQRRRLRRRAADGHPWAPSGKGTGHLWPVLSAERGEQDLATHDNEGAARCCSA
jgi:hypothetical protein